MKASVTVTGNKAKAKPATRTSAKPTRARTMKKAGTGITPERLHQLIAEEAYLRAERRGFNNGDPVSDWLAAEQDITHRLTRGLERQASD